MTTTAIETTGTKECPRCEGSGEVATTRRDPTTGAPAVATCWFCEGTGAVAEDAFICTVCSQPLLEEQTCQHGVDVLCHGCSYRCRDCVDEDLEQRAEHWMSEVDR